MVVAFSRETAGKNFARDACLRPLETWSPRSRMKIVYLLHSLLNEIQELMVATWLSADHRPRSLLAPEGGGNVFHSGGRQFALKRNPDWQALAAWINGARLAAPKKECSSADGPELSAC